MESENSTQPLPKSATESYWTLRHELLRFLTNSMAKSFTWMFTPVGINQAKKFPVYLDPKAVTVLKTLNLKPVLRGLDKSRTAYRKSQRSTKGNYENIFKGIYSCLCFRLSNWTVFNYVTYIGIICAWPLWIQCRLSKELWNIAPDTRTSLFKYSYPATRFYIKFLAYQQSDDKVFLIYLFIHCLLHASLI